MNFFGGEQELKLSNYNQAMTNSGRSSLRLIIESAELAGMHILLPNFLCQVIVDVLKENRITFDFYKVDENFEYTLPEKVDGYAAVYVIKYFGGRTDAFTLACAQVKGCLIIDDVFSPFPEVLVRNQSWYSFCSLRKISPIADLSFVYSNAHLVQVKDELPQFSRIKYLAKNQKFNYLEYNLGREQEYLELFNSSEEILDSSLGVYKPSIESVMYAFDYFSRLEAERLLRLDNYNKIKEILGDYLMNVESDFYSFAPLLLKNRDKVKSELKEHNAFLAVHWPKIEEVDNLLSSKIISVPLDSRYSKSDISRVCDLIFMAMEE